MSTLRTAAMPCGVNSSSSMSANCGQVLCNTYGRQCRSGMMSTETPAGMQLEPGVNPIFPASTSLFFFMRSSVEQKDRDDQRGTVKARERFTGGSLQGSGPPPLRRSQSCGPDHGRYQGRASGSTTLTMLARWRLPAISSS
jgi:hypothetical protein